jgi:hypothetical protein
LHCLDLVVIHGGSVIGNDVLQVLNTLLAEDALRALEDEAVFLQNREDCADMLHMFCPGTAVDKNVVEEYQYATTEGRNTSFISAWNVDGAFVKPKGITGNSK